jgi:hypothetical protein
MLLATYLNDHLAGATAARELARRAASSNRDSGYAELESHRLRAAAEALR